MGTAEKGTDAHEAKGGWKPDGLSATITEVSTGGPPNRVLVLTCVVRNRFANPVVLWKSRVSIGIGGVKIAEGDLMTAYYAAVKPMALPPGEENPSCEIRVPISRESIAAIERFRRGPIYVDVTAYFWIAPVLPNGTLGIPWENIVSSAFRNSFARYEIPVSKWLEYLSSWGYADIQLVEIPSEHRNSRLASAWQRWDEAVEAYRRGEFENSLASCYRALEAAARVMSSPNAEKADWDSITKLMNASELKRSIYDSIIFEMNGLLHKGRHDQGGKPLVPNRSDGQFAVAVTHALLLRLGE